MYPSGHRSSRLLCSECSGLFGEYLWRHPCWPCCMHTKRNTKRNGYATRIRLLRRTGVLRLRNRLVHSGDFSIVIGLAACAGALRIPGELAAKSLFFFRTVTFTHLAMTALRTISVFALCRSSVCPLAIYGGHTL